jgi:hypothetical protein
MTSIPEWKVAGEKEENRNRNGRITGELRGARSGKKRGSIHYAHVARALQSLNCPRVPGDFSDTFVRYLIHSNACAPALTGDPFRQEIEVRPPSHRHAAGRESGGA